MKRLSKKKAKSLGNTAKQKRDSTAPEKNDVENGASAAINAATDSENGASDKAAQAVDARICELYKSELKRLYLFAARWQAALPIDDRSPESERRKATVAAIKEIISDNKTINTAEQGKEIVARLTDLFAAGKKAPSDTFDLNEVLNPGELDLEALCKELGVMD